VKTAADYTVLPPRVVALRRIVQLTLVADNENTNQVLFRQEAVQRDRTGFAIGGNQFADFSFSTPDDQGVVGQGVDRTADGDGRGDGGVRVVLGKKNERAFCE